MAAPILYTLLLVLSLSCPARSCRFGWTDWSPWSPCPEECGGGVSETSRSFSCCIPGGIIASCAGGEGETRRRRQCAATCHNGGTFRYDETAWNWGYCICPDNYTGKCCEEVIKCSDPGGILNGHVSLSRFEIGDAVAFSCDLGYKLTGGAPVWRCERSGSAGVWREESCDVTCPQPETPHCAYVESCSSTPCLNGATCVNEMDTYSCACAEGWQGSVCDIDLQAPLVYNCSMNQYYNTEKLTMKLSWQVPGIIDPFGSDVIVTSNIDGNEAEFTWGDHVIQYVGRKVRNGLVGICKFSISVFPHPCPPLLPPAGGALACNGWREKEARVCFLFCPGGRTLPAPVDISRPMVCGASGRWAGSAGHNHTACSEPRNVNGIKNSRHYYDKECQGEKLLIQENYIELLTSENSPFWALCTRYPKLCIPGYVNVLCG